MMDELGHILREARETKGFTLKEVQERIRINSRFLEALETGEYEQLPTPTHVRGFLRNYARFLNLDPSPLLERYELSQSQRPRRTPTLVDTTEPVGPALTNPPEDHPFFDPVNVEVNSGYRRGVDSESILRLIIILALIGLLYLVGQRFIPMLMGNGDGTEALTEGITEAINNITNRTEETAVPTDPSESGDAIQPSGIITSTSRNDTGLTVPTPTTTRPSLPATMETIELEVVILERGFMEVTIDGNVLFSGIARPTDEPYEWTAEEEARINTGNAIGVSVTINGVPLGPLGARGEAKEEVWTTTN